MARGGILVYVDDAWLSGMRGGKRFEKEVFGGLRISGRTEEEIERIADAESTARERETHGFLTLMYVLSTRHESMVGFKCGRQRRSSSGA
jgi:hypothetical protein